MWSALGFTFEVLSLDENEGLRLEQIFSGLVSTAERSSPVELAVDPLLACEALDDLVSRVTLCAISAAEGNLLFHAGAIGDDTGQSALLCGPSGSGKSTLSVRLVETGWRYLTDETVCLDPQTLRLKPYRKPVSLKAGSQTVLAHLNPHREPTAASTWLVSPAVIDPAPLPNNSWVPRLVVFPTYRPGSGLQVSPVAPAEAAFLLGQNSSRLSRVRGGALPALARVARRVQAFRIVHDDLDAAAEAVQDLWAA